jgi:hypothetical protein
MSFTREQISQIVGAVKLGTLDPAEAEFAIYCNSYPDELPKPATRTVTVFVVVNEDDHVEAADQRDEALSRMVDNNGGNEFDIVKLTLTIDRRQDIESTLEVKRADVSTLIVEPAAAELADA